MWQLAQPWWEFVLRGGVVYLFVFILFRLTGKRQVGQLSPFDLVLLLLVGNAVQNSMNAGDNSLSAGGILMVTLVGLNILIDFLTYRFKKFQLIVEGSPKVLVHNGIIDHTVMKQQMVTRHDLDLALRQEGIADLSCVRFAILETSGLISVIEKDKPVGEVI